VSTTTPGGSCSQTRPISWLTLELFHLEELPRDEQRQVSDHLATCPGCRSCLEQIQTDQRALPALPVAGAIGAEARASQVRRRWWPARRGRLALLSAAAAMAAMLLLLLVPRELEPRIPPQRVAIKGGELAIDLVRERQGTTRLSPTHFAPGDRFKVLATWPPTDPVHAEVVVYQQGVAGFPLSPATLDGGNRQPVPGAFTLSGDQPAVVCLVVGAAPLPRGTLAGARLAGLHRLRGLDAVCLTLDPTTR